jgi:hypothetical protein
MSRFNRFLFFVIAFPAAEKMRSEGTDDGGHTEELLS